MNEVNEYCNSNGIHIFDEEAMEICEKKDHSVEQVVSTGLSEEYKMRLKKARIISDFIMNLASVKARKRVNGKGWLCGTYANRICERLERNVIRKFDESELDYIIEHLPPENDEDINLKMIDAENPQMSTYYNELLNNMIPKLHINPFYSDLFEN